MKTTIDLPESLIQRLKLTAARRGERVKVLAAATFRAALAASDPVPRRRPGDKIVQRRTQKRHRVPLPIVPVPAHTDRFALSGERVAELEAEFEMRNHEASR